MNSRQLFLLVAAIGLVPVALPYGLAPNTSLGFLFDVSVLNPNGTHLFLVAMGLYLSMAGFWLTDAYKSEVS